MAASDGYLPKMKINHRHVIFYGVADEAAVRKEARALAKLPQPADASDLRLTALARRTVPQDGALRIGSEPDLRIENLVDAAIWWGDFGTHLSPYKRSGEAQARLVSALDYAHARLTQETTWRSRRVGKRKALSEKDNQVIENLVARAIAEWSILEAALGRETSWHRITLDELDALQGHEVFRDPWQEGDDPYQDLSLAQWRALELALDRHEAGYFVSDSALVAAGYPESPLQPAEGEVWAHAIQRQSEWQKRLPRTLIHRDLLRYAHSDLIEPVEPERLAAELGEWRLKRGAELAALGLKPRSRPSGLVLAG